MSASSRSVKCLHSSTGSSDVQKQVSTLHKQVDRLTRSQADMHLGLETHTKYIDKHALQLNTLDNSLAIAVKDTCLKSSAAQVDFTVLAPRRR